MAFLGWGMALTLAVRGVALAAGFTPSGIAAGSAAAALMRIATIANGGAMSALTIPGSIIAWLQHITMVPL